MNWHLIWHYIEIVVIVAIIIFQVYILIRQLKKIKYFKELFNPKFVILPNPVNSKPNLSLRDNEFKDITQGHPLKKSVNSINTYLEHNYGSSVNFSIIEDIIDRECDVRDEEISQGNNIPLYLGLAATMIGIILGLLSMGSLSMINVSDESASSQFTQSIDSLISGVRLAMTSSLCGLAITTFLSVFIYKGAKVEISAKQSEILNLLQAKLLLPASNNELQGVKQSIDDFSRNVGQVINRFESVSNTNAQSAEIINDTLSKQLIVTEKIENMSLPRMTQKTIELFSQLNDNMQVYQGFTKYLELMNKISGELASFAQRTSDIETLAERFRDTLDESLRLTRFLDEHFKGIENVSTAALGVVDVADAHFREAVNKLSDEMANRINTLNSESNNFEEQVSEVFRAVGNQLQTITAEHVNKLSEAYSTAVPNFRKLDKLDYLDSISTSTQMSQLISAINVLSSKLDNIDKNTSGLTVLKPRPTIWERIFAKKKHKKEGKVTRSNKKAKM